MFWNLTPSGLLALATLGLVTLAWYRNLQARELAVRIARDTCRQQGLQLLDATVALQRLALRRDPAGRLALQRTYRFEYTEDSFSRQQGFVVLHGARLETVGLAPRLNNG